MADGGNAWLDLAAVQERARLLGAGICFLGLERLLNSPNLKRYHPHTPILFLETVSPPLPSKLSFYFSKRYHPYFRPNSHSISQKRPSVMQNEFLVDDNWAILAAGIQEGRRFHLLPLLSYSVSVFLFL